VACLVLLAGYAGGRKANSVHAHRVPAREAPAQLESTRAARSAALDGLSRRVDSELVDAAWSPQTERTIERVISAQLGPAVSVAEATCGSTICRAKLSHPGSPRISDEAFLHFTLNRASLGSMEIQLDTRAEGSTVLYFLRSGGGSAE
jgi:hypothetical protein